MDKSFLKNKKKGFGSSDAADILRYAASGELNNSLHRRISEIKGEIERQEVFSKYFDLGNRVEDDVFAYIDNRYVQAQNNPTNALPEDQFNNFTVYTHVDFTTENFWFELKATKENIYDSIKKYQSQLAWHQMIKDELMKSFPDGLDYMQSMQFLHYDTSDCYADPSTYQFDEARLSARPVESFIETQKALWSGLEKLDEEWDSIEPFVEKEVIYMSESEAHEVAAMRAIETALLMEREAKRIKEEIRGSLMKNMIDRGVKTISTPNFTISVRDGHVRASLDSSKVKKLVGDNYEQYTRKTQIKPSITIKLKTA